MKDLEIEWEEKQKQLLEREEEMNRAMEVAQQDLIQSQRFEFNKFLFNKKNC